MQTSSTYSLLRSRTFWTVIFMFAFNGFAAISGSLPATASVIINLILSTLASYFHLAGVQNSTTPTV